MFSRSQMLSTCKVFSCFLTAIVPKQTAVFQCLQLPLQVSTHNRHALVDRITCQPQLQSRAHKTAAHVPATQQAKSMRVIDICICKVMPVSASSASHHITAIFSTHAHTIHKVQHGLHIHPAEGQDPQSKRSSTQSQTRCARKLATPRHARHQPLCSDSMLLLLPP